MRGGSTFWCCLRRYGFKLTRNHSKFDTSMFIPSYSLSLLHQQRPETLQESSVRPSIPLTEKRTWCWNLVGSRPCTGTAVPYTCSSLTMLHPPSSSPSPLTTSSGRKVPSSEHFRSRNNPTRISRSGSSYERKVSQPPLAV